MFKKKNYAEMSCAEIAHERYKEEKYHNAVNYIVCYGTIFLVLLSVGVLCFTT